MENCVNTEKDVDKMLAKFDTYKKQVNQTLDQLLTQLEQLRQQLLQNGDADVLADIVQATGIQQAKKVKSSCQKLSTQHKDLHGSVSRIGKTIDRNFDSQCGSVNIPEILNNANHHKLLHTAICEHFYRQGSLGIAESLVNESSLDIDFTWRQPFIEMNEILKSLQERKVDYALEWAARNQSRLSEEKSSLEFKLHRLKFLGIINKGPSHQYEALQYSRKFQSFAKGHSAEIQQLMGCFLYIRQGLSSSPYASLLSESMWDDVHSTFAHDACKLLGLSVDSPLHSAFIAGCQALPALLAIKSVIEQRQCSGILSNNDELPIDIDLDNSQQYHSIFACPILRQQTTEKNPPMRLVCGHVISQDALNKLVSSSKVKCPYCPVEQLPGDAKQVYF